MNNAVVSEWEVFQVRHQFDPATAVFGLDGATEAENTSLPLGCFLRRRLALLFFGLLGIKDDEDVEVPLLSSLLHVPSHVALIESAVGEDDHEWAARGA